MNTKEIWSVKFDPAVGSEINKLRPGIIVNDDSIGRLPLRVVVPLTNWNERYNAADWMVKITPDGTNNLSKESAADAFQVKSVSVDRLTQKIGCLSDTDYDKVKTALRNVLGL